MFSKELADKINVIAQKEIALYGLPTKRHYELSMEKGIEFCVKKQVKQCSL